jgi:F-type H+-transporting ATPase subunit a
VSGFLSGLVPLETGGFEAPGVHSFDFPPIFESVPWLDKYMFQAILSVILILAFWLIMARKSAMVPSKGQYIGETAYFFVRNTIARDMIGHDFRRYLPLLIALFSFVLVNNVFGIFPFLLLPTPSHVGWPYGLAILVWLIYNGVGIATHGFFGYLKHTSLPSGVPAFMWPFARSPFPCDSSPTCSPATC